MKRCLIIEKNILLANLMKQQLKQNKIEADITLTIKEAHDLLSNSGITHVWYDALIVDTRSPFSNKLEITDRLPLLDKSKFEIDNNETTNFIQHTVLYHKIKLVTVTIGYKEERLIEELYKSGTQIIIRKGPKFLQKLSTAFEEWERSKELLIFGTQVYETGSNLNSNHAVLNIDLRINEQKNELKVRSWLIPLSEGPSFYIEKVNVKPELARIAKDLEDIPDQNKPNCQDSLKNIGKDVYESLFQSQRVRELYVLAKQFCKDDDENIIVVFNGDVKSVDIPFELVRKNVDNYLLFMHPVLRRPSAAWKLRKSISLNNTNSKQKLRALIVSAYTYGKINIGVDVLSVRQDSKLRSGMEEEAALVNKIMENDKQQRFDPWLMSEEQKSTKVTKQAIEKFLLNEKCDIFHFVGHGYHCKSDPDESCIIVWDEENHNALTTINVIELKSLLEDAHVRFAYFSCCEGADSASINNSGYFRGLLHGILEAQVPNILCFRWPLFDEYGVKFAERFYTQWCKLGNFANAIHKTRRKCKNDPFDMKKSYCWASSVMTSHDYGLSGPIYPA